MQPSSRNCCAAPISVSVKLICARIFFSRGVFFSQTPVCPDLRARCPRNPRKPALSRRPRWGPLCDLVNVLLFVVWLVLVVVVVILWLVSSLVLLMWLVNAACDPIAPRGISRPRLVWVRLYGWSLHCREFSPIENYMIVDQCLEKKWAW